MAAPVSVDDFLVVLTRSKLVEEDCFDRFLRGLDPIPEEPEQLTEALVAAGLLTGFQAENLLKGRYLRFFIGPYKVLDRIGSGSSGAVYLCEHQRMLRRVAVKVLLGRKAQDEEAVLRFEREARAAASLDHPNIVRAHDLAREDHLYYLVMEYVDGVSLQQRLSKGPLPPKQVAEYLLQAAQGLQHAHEAGLIHRDLKPGNLMVARNGLIKILDLGLARFADDEIDVTRGAVLGHALYMPPEQARDSHAVDARADIYSLGATFLHCLTGRIPHPAGSSGGPRAPAGVDQRHFKRILKLLRQMMAEEPADRPQTAGEVQQILASWKSASAGTATAVHQATTGTETAALPRSPSRVPATASQPVAVSQTPAVPPRMRSLAIDPAVRVATRPVKTPSAPASRSRFWLVVGIGAVVMATALVLYWTLAGEDKSGPTPPPLPSAPPTPRWTPRPVSPHSP
jgi:serine/threonine protein kinase